jgi:NTE family protein
MQPDLNIENDFEPTPDDRFASAVGLIRPMLSHLFGHLSQQDWEKLDPFLEEMDLPGGYYLFRKGDRGDAMYIVINGRLQVRLENDHQIQVINEIGRGESVGEMALITGENRSASIYAIRDCHLIRISKDAFLKFLNMFPAVGLNLAKLMIDRFNKKQLNRRLRAVSNIAIIPIHRDNNLDNFAKPLEESFTKSGKRVKMLSSTYIDSVLGEGAAQTSLNLVEQNKKLSAWLERQENNNDLVFYLPDLGATEWTKRCIRQADEIILVSDSTAPPSLSKMEQQILSGDGKLSTARQTLVLMHPGGDTLPANTSRWLTNRQVGFHLHIRADKKERDFDRLVRYLTDNLTGLVLAGGGAKGFAHIGVWRALEEANMPIDFIGGTSMGSFVGGLMAFDWNYEKVYEICREIAFSPLKRDFNLLPVLSLFKGKVLDKVLQKYYLQHDIEDCILPFYCVSSNMTNAHPKIHRRGNMFRAIRASGSIPAVVPPVVERDGLLIDGGVFNNFPTDVMVDIGAKFIIGVDFLVDQNQQISIREMPSNWRALATRWFGGPRKSEIPTLIGTIIESTTLYSSYMQKQNSEKTDIYINPDVNQYSMLEWKSYDKIVQKGYEEAKRSLYESAEKIEPFVSHQY